MLGFAKKFIAFLDIPPDPASHGERLISTIGGFLGILAVIRVTEYFVPSGGGASLVVASIGASTVLLFILPKNPYSQPWPLFVGHLVPGAIGVSCATLIPDFLIAASLTVSLAILAMHYLRCIHPPGAATALTAVAGGPEIHTLGYHYLLTPVLLNVIVIFVMAVLVHCWFPGRRYPTSLNNT